MPDSACLGRRGNRKIKGRQEKGEGQEEAEREGSIGRGKRCGPPEFQLLDLPVTTKHQLNSQHL